ncbi:MAG TPA: type II and III secretion system protein family protein [Candidatus Sulfotelmatobacter sp.]|jgi:pilus assembly protein CpaC|nr:type II and III secretion system protein family protein [Candidatus Sulfotelmatobacter sp.]
MKVRRTFFVALALSLLLPMFVSMCVSRFALAEALPQQPATQAPQEPTPPATTQTTLPPQSAQPQGSAPLRVMVDKSLLINTTEQIRRVSITDPNVADVTPLTGTQILVHGRSPGEVSLIIWDELERSRSFDLRVDVDVSACAEEEHRVFPEEQISVTPSRAAIVLSGHVTTEDVAKRAGELASAYSKNVVNVLTFGPVGAQEVLLEVKFAEVDRSALTQLGANLFSTGAGNLIGTSTTGQYGGFATQSISQTQGQNTPFPATQTISNVLNMFLFQPNIHLGAVIEALATKNLLQILSEPTLIAVNGKKASFLAGGQFPFPIVQPGAGFTAVTISFKEFGVKLDFTPVIMPNGNIHLTVAPEVSTLDFADALTISGFTIPALSTRKAETEFELRDGQSFVIAGLIDNRVTDTWEKVPGLGDIPILGAFFRSKNVSKSNQELMVLCTVHRISPNTESPSGPKQPDSFINNDKFDGKKPSGK